MSNLLSAEVTRKHFTELNYLQLVRRHPELFDLIAGLPNSDSDITSWDQVETQLQQPLTIHEQNLLLQLRQNDISPTSFIFYATFQALAGAQKGNPAFAEQFFWLYQARYEGAYSQFEEVSIEDRVDGVAAFAKALEKVQNRLALPETTQMSGMHPLASRILPVFADIDFHIDNPDEATKDDIWHANKKLWEAVGVIAIGNPVVALHMLLNYRYWAQLTEYDEWLERVEAGTEKYPNMKPVHPATFFTDTSLAHAFNGATRKVRAHLGHEAETVQWPEMPPLESGNWESIYTRYKWVKQEVSRLTTEYKHLVAQAVANEGFDVSTSVTSVLTSEWLNKMNSLVGHIRFLEPIVNAHQLWMYDREFSDEHEVLVTWNETLKDIAGFYPTIPDEFQLTQAGRLIEAADGCHTAYYSAEVQIPEEVTHAQVMLVRNEMSSGYVGHLGEYQVLTVKHDVTERITLSAEASFKNPVTVSNSNYEKTNPDSQLTIDYNAGVAIVIFCDYDDGRPPEMYVQTLDLPAAVERLRRDTSKRSS